MFITRGELGPENLGELKILAKYNLMPLIVSTSEIGFGWPRISKKKENLLLMFDHRLKFESLPIDRY